VEKGHTNLCSGFESDSGVSEFGAPVAEEDVGTGWVWCWGGVAE